MLGYRKFRIIYGQKSLDYLSKGLRKWITYVAPGYGEVELSNSLIRDRSRIPRYDYQRLILRSKSENRLAKTRINVSGQFGYKERSYNYWRKNDFLYQGKED